VGSAALGKMLIIDNLQKLHVIVVNWCVMCKKNGESVRLLVPFGMSSSNISGCFGLCLDV